MLQRVSVERTMVSTTLPQSMLRLQRGGSSAALPAGVGNDKEIDTRGYSRGVTEGGLHGFDEVGTFLPGQNLPLGLQDELVV